MKIVKWCSHLIRSEEQMVKELFKSEHDGRIFVITEICQKCFTEIILKGQAL
jgi:hypothetical protein